MQDEIGHGALERLRNRHVDVFLKLLAIVECVGQVLRVIAWVDAEDEIVGAGAGISGG